MADNDKTSATKTADPGTQPEIEMVKVKINPGTMLPGAAFTHPTHTVKGFKVTITGKPVEIPQDDWANEKLFVTKELVKA